MQAINRLILGDNLEALKQIESESVDLIYLDPPFFSNRNYEVIWGDEGEVRSFKDRWSGGMDHYIGWLKERVEQMHRLLNKGGSIFLHCDWHANAYIRVDILDRIFGYQNFRNEIVWKRTSAHNDSKKLGQNTDTIFFYSKSANPTFNTIYQPYDEEYKKRFRNTDPNGRSWVDGDLGKPDEKGYRYEYKGVKPPANGWRCPIETMKKWDDEGRLHFTASGGIRLKKFLDELPGMPAQALWTDIFPVNSQAKERIGYPTQKPEALMERIIKMSSNEGDLVLDAFVGGGTTVAVADKLHRRWIGIDQSVQAIKVTEFRLNQQQDLFSKPFVLQLHKYDYDTLRYKNAFAFEAWIIEQFDALPNTKQRSDYGLDGKMKDGTPIQVKRSDNIGRNVIDNFLSAVQRSDKKLYEKNAAAGKPIGYIIAFSFGKGAIEEVARLKNKENIIIKLVEVSTIVPISKKPSIAVDIKEEARDKKGLCEIEFTARGESGAGIEFFSWDWDYVEANGFKPEVIRDTHGKQRMRFKPGTHNIAVKVVDNDGLDNIEVIKLKVNGKIERD